MNNDTDLKIKINFSIIHKKNQLSYLCWLIYGISYIPGGSSSSFSRFSTGKSISTIISINLQQQMKNILMIFRGFV